MRGRNVSAWRCLRHNTFLASWRIRSPSWEPFAIEPLHPDAFLMDLHGLDNRVVYEAVVRQAAKLRRPPMLLDELLDRLAVTVPRFARALRDTPGRQIGSR
jgi:hypothetical protein